MGQIYQYVEKVVIKANREQLIQYYLDKDLRKKWQKNLSRVNVIGNEYDPGRVFELFYQLDQHQMKMTETLISLSLPDSFDVLYEVTGVKNLCQNQFIEENDSLSWIMNVTFEFIDQAPYPIDQFKLKTRNSMHTLKDYIEKNV